MVLIFCCMFVMVIWSRFGQMCPNIIIFSWKIKREIAFGVCRRTGWSLVEVEESTQETNTTSQSHGLGETTLSYMWGSKFLEGVESSRSESSGDGAGDAIGCTGIAHDSLEVTAKDQQNSTQLQSRQFDPPKHFNPFVSSSSGIGGFQFTYGSLSMSYNIIS